MKLRWWYGIAFNLILAALFLFGAAFYIVHIKGGYIVRKRSAPATEAEGRGSTLTNILVIKDTNSNLIYGRWQQEGNGEFAIEFIHSVNNSPVREFYQIEDRMIRPSTVRFSSFGAGMQSDLEEGQTLSRDGDAMVISGFSASLNELNYIVGTVSDHLLIINGETISLLDLCGKNAHIKIYVE
ncbi:MAG: DUF1850 domain-containing protein [Treponema sp.]|jgi:hypothetical protein|nr:DUF1850 domain-containing protein [Treponema sp.]